MKFSTNKTKATTISFVLVLTISAILVALPPVIAHDPPRTKDSWTYIGVSPNPIGQGQQVLITFWLDTLPQTASGAYGDRYQFTIDVTKPDNSKETLGPITSDPVGGGYWLYTVDQVGTYTFQSFFPTASALGVSLYIQTYTDDGPGGDANLEQFQVVMHRPIDNQDKQMITDTSKPTYNNVRIRFTRLGAP